MLWSSFDDLSISLGWSTARELIDRPSSCGLLDALLRKLTTELCCAIL
jgi:hypothetical protein